MNYNNSAINTAAAVIAGKSSGGGTMAQHNKDLLGAVLAVVVGSVTGFLLLGLCIYLTEGYIFKNVLCWIPYISKCNIGN